MAIIRKPEIKNMTSNEAIDIIDKIISKGGSVPSDRKTIDKLTAQIQSHAEKVVAIKLNIPVHLLDEVDNLLATFSLKKTRRAWILEAMTDKLRKDQKDIF